jgi:hypothetical protein
MDMKKLQIPSIIGKMQKNYRIATTAFCTASFSFLSNTYKKQLPRIILKAYLNAKARCPGSVVPK